MVGTMPLMSHVPANAPISNKMRMALIEAVILSTIPLSIFEKETFKENPTSAAAVAASINASWLAPDVAISP